MSTLYDMTVRRKTLVCHTDGSVETAFKTETMTALPGTFVSNFRRSFPDAVVSVVERFVEAVRSSAGGRRQHHASQPAGKGTARGPAAAPAAGGDSFELGELINEEIAS